MAFDCNLSLETFDYAEESDRVIETPIHDVKVIINKQKIQIFHHLLAFTEMMLMMIELTLSAICLRYVSRT